MLAEAANPAEQVQFVRADAQGGGVLAADLWVAGGRQFPRQTLTTAAAVGTHGRQQFGALDTVLGAVGVDVQRRHTQVEVVLQGGLDQLLQRRVAEKLAPALFAGGLLGHGIGPVGRALRPLRGNAGRRLLVIRDQRAATEGEGGERQG